MTDVQRSQVEGEWLSSDEAPAIAGGLDITWLAATVAGVGHDMSTPLATIASAIDLLNQKDRQESAELLAMMRRQVSHLDRLADDLRDFGPLISGISKLTLQRFNVSELLRQVVEDAVIVERRTIELEFDEGVLHVYADAYAVRRILENLLGNALKYSPRTEPVRIHARRLPPRTILLAVEDQAGSMNPEELKLAFQPFVRNRADSKGYGLGLFIVRSLAEAQGARVWAELLPGGSRFCLALPQDAPQP